MLQISLQLQKSNYARVICVNYFLIGPDEFNITTVIYIQISNHVTKLFSLL